jgi:carbonic anhydrase
MVTMSEKMGIELSGYKDFPTGEMVDLGATLQFYLGEPTVDSGAKMTLTKADGEMTEWWPWQFHFHAPSEHTVGGQLMDLEIHFVHLPPDYDPEGVFNAAVLGVFFDRSAGGNEPNPFIESLMFQEGGAAWDVTNVDVKKFLDGLDTKSFMSY